MPTIREQMIDLLSEGPLSAHDISQTLKIQEKEVYSHLSHIKRSLLARRRRLYIVAARCISCGFTFKDRERFKKPGHCPVCRSGRIRPPQYGVVT